MFFHFMGSNSAYINGILKKIFSESNTRKTERMKSIHGGGVVGHEDRFEAFKCVDIYATAWPAPHTLTHIHVNQ